MSTSAQAEMCRVHGSSFDPCGKHEKLGVALATLHLLPLNALRHPREGDASGWYIWGGELLSKDAGFFEPLHVQHIGEHAPQVVPFLGLAPGWRVLLATGQEDVWHDASLLTV